MNDKRNAIKSSGVSTAQGKADVRSCHSGLLCPCEPMYLSLSILPVDSVPSPSTSAQKAAASMALEEEGHNRQDDHQCSPSF